MKAQHDRYSRIGIASQLRAKRLLRMKAAQANEVVRLTTAAQVR